MKIKSIFRHCQTFAGVWEGDKIVPGWEPLINDKKTNKQTKKQNYWTGGTLKLYSGIILKLYIRYRILSDVENEPYFSTVSLPEEKKTGCNISIS